MTCVVGLVYQNQVWIGADTAGTNSSLSSARRKDEKVFIREGFIFGFSGSYRAGQLLRWQFSIPNRPKGQGVEEFMNSSFVEGIRSCLKTGGVSEKHYEAEVHRSSFLVGYDKRLFCIEGDYQVGERHEPYNAIGCGDDLALGSMFTTQKALDNPYGRIKMALEAAERFSAGVRRPFTIKMI